MRVIGIHYWDTRPKLTPYWEQNARIIKHNYDTLMKNLPAGWTVDHHIFIDWQANVPLVDELAHQLGKVHFYAPVRQRHFFNAVQQSAFDMLDFAGYDLILQMTQDRLIINRTNYNLIDLMWQMMDGSHCDLAHQRDPPYDYVSHTIPARPDWGRWNHNAGGSHGLCKIECIPEIMRAYYQEARAAEVYLGWSQYMGRPCLYMQVNPYIYWGDYAIQDLTPARADYLLSLVEEPLRYKHMIEVVEHQWCASLHPLWKEVA